MALDKWPWDKSLFIDAAHIDGKFLLMKWEIQWLGGFVALTALQLESHGGLRCVHACSDRGACQGEFGFGDSAAMLGLGSSYTERENKNTGDAHASNRRIIRS